MAEEKKDSIRGFGRKMTTSDKVKCALWSVLVVLFAVWMVSFIPLLALPFIVDLYWSHFIKWDWWKEIKNGFVRGVMSWVDAIVFALCAVWVLQNFFFQNFQIPTTSLEKSMLAGDYLLVSKYHYGPRIPMTPLSLPLFQHTISIGDTELGKSYIEKPQVPYRRMAGLKEIERYDIVVFNYPNGDTVATKHQDDDYYRLKFHHGVQALHTNKAQYGDIIYRPVDRRENYVKRCIGLPGEELKIVEDQVYINGEKLEDPRYLQHNYFVVTQPGSMIAERTWRNLGVYNSDLYEITNPQISLALGLEPDSISGASSKVYMSPLTAEMQKKLRQLKTVKDIVMVPADFFGKDYVYPLSESNSWTRSNYGPILIPKCGMTVKLTPENIALYERCIKVYEGNDFKVTDGQCYIDGKPVAEYTFKMDYYWMMGDNRDNSADSRYWGFVPEDHIVGTPLFIWMSIDQETGEWRKDRFFKRVSTIDNE